MSVTAIFLSIAMIQLDQAATAKRLDQLAWVYAGGPEGARAVLSTIASSMITVAGVTFSITIVALTLASQQFGPRLLRNFLRDLGNQVVLGTFVSTYVYCLLVLRTVRGSDDAEFVPHLAVTGGVVLAMMSLGVLIFFIHHVATSIQASHIIANVAADLDAAIDRLFPNTIGEGAAAASVPSVWSNTYTDGRPLVATTSGYVQVIDGAGLLAVAHKHDVVVRLHARPGSFVRSRAVLATITATPGRAHPDYAPFHDVFIIGSDRTGSQDVTFFFDQLVELAVRALSPAINDPGTARLCIDRIEQALCHLAGRQVPPAEQHDSDGHARVLGRSWTFPDIVEIAFNEIAPYARSSTSVTCRLLEALRNVGSCVTREVDRAALLREATAIRSNVAKSALSDSDRELVAQCHRATIAALHDPIGV
jgi:uncharacterized membrane protein